MQKSTKVTHYIKTDNDVYTNTYISSDGYTEIEIKVWDNDGERSTETWEFNIPLGVARKLSLELAEDIKNHDEKMAKKIAEEKTKESQESDS
jgi:hypothetical protein